MNTTAPTPGSMPSSSAKVPDTRGLAGQAVGETAICEVNQTQLVYRGYEIADLAENATFDEVAFLLLVVLYGVSALKFGRTAGALRM